MSARTNFSKHFVIKGISAIGLIIYSLGVFWGSLRCLWESWIMPWFTPEKTMTCMMSHIMSYIMSCIMSLSALFGEKHNSLFLLWVSPKKLCLKDHLQSSWICCWERPFWAAEVAAPMRKEWLEKFSAGMPDSWKTDFRCFWNQKCVTGLLESSMNRGSRWDLAWEFLSWRYASIVWNGWIGHKRFKIYMKWPFLVWSV